MPRKPDTPCASCGRLCWPTNKTRAASLGQVCHPCRAQRLVHGKPYTYNKRGCRCDLCRAAWNAQCTMYGNHRKRARSYGVAYTPVDPLAIFERDGWVCGICALPVDPDVRFPDPGSASLDHVLPMSRGGGHVPTNLQLAHFYCNNVKGARVTEEGAAAC